MTKREESKVNDEKSGSDRTSGATFMMAALDMSWRLAIVVLVPIIGGYEIDRHAGTAPALTIIGFLVAMAGLAAVMRWTIKTADAKFKTGAHK